MSEYRPVPLPDVRTLSDEDMQRAARDYYQFIKRRHSVRAYNARPVPRQVIEDCIRAAGTAPSGANHQPWHFVCVNDPATKRRIRIAAEKEEAAFYGGKAGQEWLDDLEPLGTDQHKPFLETAPWLIAIFCERYAVDEAGNRSKHYYMPESVGIATGFLINALHSAGLGTLTHTPSPMKFLNRILQRPGSERPYLLLVVGHPAEDAEIPAAAAQKKPLSEIATFVD